MSGNHNVSLAGRLIRVVENNAEELAEGALQKVKASPRTAAYHSLPSNDLRDRAFDVFHDLGCWLWEKSDVAVEQWYNELGERRWEEGIPLGQVVWALTLTKDHLIHYLDSSGFADSAVELYQQQEFDRTVSHFFDRAICYTAEGYERRAVKQRAGSADRVRTAVMRGA
jgi:hypothetical protein